MMDTPIPSKTILGLPFYGFVYAYAKSNDLDKKDALANVINMLDEGEIEYASPYYDSDKGKWIVGYEVGSRLLPVEAFINKILKTKQCFIEQFKFEPKVYSPSHIY